MKKFEVKLIITALDRDISIKDIKELIETLNIITNYQIITDVDEIIEFHEKFAS